MKKKIITIIFALMFSLFSVAVLPSYVAAASTTSVWDYSDRIEHYSEEFVGDADRQGRFAGTDAEKNAADYIVSALNTIGLAPVNNLSTENGVQKFSIYNDYEVLSSQNIVYKRVGQDSSKKVIIATHYDIDYEYEYNSVSGETTRLGSEGVFSSGANVGGMLALAELISSYNFDYDVEFVFFGGYYNNLSGSEYYTSFISEDDAKNILLMINFDKLASNGKLYMYTGEFENSTDEFVTSAFTTHLNARNLSNYNIVSYKDTPSASGLNYSNFALESDNANFIRLGVNTLSLNSISDDCVNKMGVVSYYPPISVKNDKLSVYEANNIDYAANISLAINGVIDLITHEDFLSVMSEGKSSDLYSFVGNEKLIIFITLLSFVVICFIVYIGHEVIEKKSKAARENMDYANIMSSIKEEELEDIDKLVSRLQQEIEAKERENAQRELTPEELEIIKKAEAEDEKYKNQKEALENNQENADDKSSESQTDDSGDKPQE